MITFRSRSRTIQGGGETLFFSAHNFGTVRSTERPTDISDISWACLVVAKTEKKGSASKKVTQLERCANEQGGKTFSIDRTRYCIWIQCRRTILKLDKNPASARGFERRRSWMSFPSRFSFEPGEAGFFPCSQSATLTDTLIVEVFNRDGIFAIARDAIREKRVQCKKNCQVNAHISQTFFVAH